MMERSNKGDEKAIARVLDTAYGQKGPLRWIILKVRVLVDPALRF